MCPPFGSYETIMAYVMPLGWGRPPHQFNVQALPGLNQLGAHGVIDMGFLKVIRIWALRDQMPVREIAIARRLVTIANASIKAGIPWRLQPR